MDIVLSIGIFLTEILKYLMFLIFFQKEELRRLWLIPEFSILYIIMMCFKFPIVVTAVILAIILLFCTVTKAHGKIVISVVFLDCISEILMIFIHKTIAGYNNTLSEEVFYFFTNIIVIAFLVLYQLFVVRRINRNIHISANILYVLLGIVTWTILLTIVLLQSISNNPNDKALIKIIDWFSVLAFLGIFFLMWAVLYIYRLNEQLKESYSMEHNLKEAQKAYYHVLLEREEETRKYRHDISNHMICLRQMSSEGKLQEVTEYIEAMDRQLGGINRVVYDTGNDVLNIMLNYYIGTVQKAINVSIVGRITQNIEADNYTLCTIFSNVLKNAVEEFMRLADTENLILQVNIGDGASNVKIEICNTSGEKEMDRDGIRTVKPDKRNHGMGLENVRRAVEKCHGMYEVDYDKGLFINRIYLPYRIVDIAPK